MKYIFIIALLIGFCLNSQASLSKGIDANRLNKIVKAIYIIEGGVKTKYPYGIRSIDTKGDVLKAKRICENTVRNNFVRWRNAGSKGNYLDYLADVYCPQSTDRQGNINWHKNIHKIVDKP
jgi:hypothetical protein